MYLSNKELLRAVKEAKEQGTMTNELARMLQLLCSRYAAKGNFVNYSYNEDMQAYAMLMLVKTWHRFDPAQSNNPFAFYTQCIKHSYIQYLNQEKRQRTLRDLLLVDQGLNPSFAFQDDDASDRHFVDDEQDFEHIRETANALRFNSDTVEEEISLFSEVDLTEEDTVDENEEISDNNE